MSATGSLTANRRVGKSRKLGWKTITPYLFIAPAFAVLIVFHIFPIFQSFRLSLLDYNFMDASKSVFVGFDNYKQLFHDELVWISLWNTFYYSVGTVIPGLLIALIFALIITEPWFKFPNFARSILFIPVILSITIAGLMWSWLYSPSFGLFNYLLNLVGLPKAEFIGNPNTAMLCVIVMIIWKALGYNVTIWCAGLLSLPKDFREAARVDGATWLQEFFLIKLPLLKPVAMFLTVLGFISSFQAFDAVYVMTGGGPMHKTSMYVFYLWQSAFRDVKIGYASAMAWFLFIILITLTIIQFRSYGEEASE